MREILDLGEAIAGKQEGGGGGGHQTVDGGER